MNNPGSILKLWIKAVATHEKGKDAQKLAKKGQEQKTKIKQGLKILKVQGATDLAAPANAERFILLRDKVGKLLTRYCRYLKAAKDEDEKILPKYLKTVKKLTALVLKLDPGSLSQVEEEPSLESIEGVDVAAVEKALAAPDTDGDIDIDLPLPQDEVADKDEPKPNPAAAWEARRQEVEPLYLAALKGLHPNASQLRAVFAFAVEKADAADYTKAMQALDKLAGLLSTSTGANGAAMPKAAAALQQWQVACTEVKNQLRKVEAEIVKAKDVNSNKAVFRLQSVIKNLANAPATQQEVLELERWIGGDDVITRVEEPNPWGIPVKVRDKLLPVLATLKPQLPG